MSKILAKIYEHEGKSIEVLFSETVFFNATVAGKAFGRIPRDWLRLDETRRYIDALCARIQVDENQLVRKVNGGAAPGTWFHQKLIVPYGRWLNPDFAVWCDEIIFDLMTNNSKQKNESKPFDIKAIDQHTVRAMQIQHSKDVNAEMYNRGGRAKVISYNQLNCQVRTGKLPSEVIADGKAKGLKASERTSAKEVLRNTQPEKACGMSLADSLILRGGDERKILAISVQSESIFKGIIELGITPAELLI